MKISIALIISLFLSAIHPSALAADPKTTKIYSIVFRGIVYCMTKDGYFRDESEAKIWFNESLASVDVTMDDYYSIRNPDPISFDRMVEQYLKNEGGCEALVKGVERLNRAQNSKAPALKGKDAADPFQW